MARVMDSLFHTGLGAKEDIKTLSLFLFTQPQLYPSNFYPVFPINDNNEHLLDTRLHSRRDSFR